MGSGGSTPRKATDLRVPHLRFLTPVVAPAQALRGGKGVSDECQEGLRSGGRGLVGGFGGSGVVFRQHASPASDRQQPGHAAGYAASGFRRPGTAPSTSPAAIRSRPAPVSSRRDRELLHRLPTRPPLGRYGGSGSGGRTVTS